MITLKKVDKDNYRKILDIKMNGEQDKFVAPNVYSLAQAWVFYDEARPFAIYNDDEVIGFIMLRCFEEERDAGVWRFMIAEEHQGKGYGRQAMKCIIDMIANEGKFDTMGLDFVENNVVAKHLYESLGFKETGEVEDGSIVMSLSLTPFIKTNE